VQHKLLMMTGRLLLLILPIVLACKPMTKKREIHEADVIVYGGTSAAIVAAVQIVRMQKSVIVVSPDAHIGGLTSGGLGWTDTGKKEVIGGIAREFYHRIWQHYQNDSAWRWQDQSEYGNRGQGTPAIDGDHRTMWIFEPHVAEKVFEDLVDEGDIQIFRDTWLDRSATGIIMEGNTIQSFRALSGEVFRGKVFIDATYEGDLMGLAGVEYHVGREANSVYGEEWNGVQVGVLHHAHHMRSDIDPYLVPGDPSSGVLPRISTDDPGHRGQGDHRIQAYCFRMCLSNHPDNRIIFPKPEQYDPYQYELLARIFDAGWREVFHKFDPIPNRKTDTNNHGPFSTDNIGMNYAYPEASYAQRREIIKEHENYQKGLMYFLANDEKVPAEVRAEMSQWGLAADEFGDNDHWPHQIYVREARRMVGEFVMTEHEIMERKPVSRSIGMGSYTMDSHNVQRYITPDGYVQNEGDIGVHPPKPYQIDLGAILPKEAQCNNLLVPVCVSSSHIAFGSIRMEPVFMILGQSAGTLAAISIEQERNMHQISYEELRSVLLKDGQVLNLD
jgi:hypothetical protein